MKTLTVQLKRTSRKRIEQLIINEMKRLKVFGYIEALGGWRGELEDESAANFEAQLKRHNVEVEVK